ncbi:biorientation of chromosomes in cell division protein 1-like 1 [Neodiprion pinetum]|uniref:biorientation of chromosomes in cell division protein 1-like 1 n=1 Tax=Neodiprion pinetum TaxID=441929 RepID=UPI001EDE0E0E|nr:biorientation of chromosomes in cell division protein 1-like 1 [Neodiprion pinetum]
MEAVDIGSTLLAGDPRLVDHIVGEVKSQGIFDQFRKECIADVDTKPAYQNLRTRVESSVNTFLCKQIWKPDMNKNQLRENLRKHIHDAAYLDVGVERIVDQVVNPKVYSVFMSQIEDVVHKFLGIERPKEREKNGTKSLKDLLPKDLDPVSPESDKNSLKDVSLESVDANLTATVVSNDHLPPKDANKTEINIQSNENSNDKSANDCNSANRQSENLNDQSDGTTKNSNKNLFSSNLNISGKSDDKPEEEEEDSPMFEPIDIMNFNESNDSHLSGISELTSHRSRSPDFSNDFSRENLDFSNHDSQLSKVSSDSRLSIVTDFGLSNHATTPMLPEASKEESNKGKSVESVHIRSSKDNFKAIRDIESNKGNSKDGRNLLEIIQSKETSLELRDCKDSKSIKASIDSTDAGVKDKNDSKDKYKDSDAKKTKSSKDKDDIKELKSYKDRDKDHRKKQTSHSSSKHEKTDKYSKDKYKEKSDKSRDSFEKPKENLEKGKEAEKLKEEKRDSDKKESVGKDLKDIYKEKIRELREKKELTEKEKLAKDPKESKSTRDSRDRKDSSRDRRDSRSSSAKNSSRHEDKASKNDDKSVVKTDSKSSSKGNELKDPKSETKDKGKRDDKWQSKDGKESRSKSYSNAKSDSTEKSDKSEAKKEGKNDIQTKDLERNERSDARRDSKLETKKDLKTEPQSKDCEKNDRLEAKKDSKVDSQNKERKRKNDKKTKAKDDHFSLRKNPSERRSTDRDGSNGSSSKNSQKSSSSSIANSGRTGSSSLTKESGGTSNSSSETSDSVDISPSDEIMSPIESMEKDKESVNRVKPLTIKITNENETSQPNYYIESDLMPKRVELGHAELSLPLKKRPLQTDISAPNPNDFKVKKPKFAKNFQEAKKLMKIRKKMEKQRMKEYEAAKEKFQMANHSDKPTALPATDKDKESPMLPDDERVQIIEVTDDDYEEPYPDLSMKEINISLERQSISSLENPLVFNPEENLANVLEKQSTLSEMEKSIRRSLEDMISDRKLTELKTQVENSNDSMASMTSVQNKASVATVHDVVDVPKQSETGSKSETTVINSGNKRSSITKAAFDRTINDALANNLMEMKYTFEAEAKVLQSLESKKDIVEDSVKSIIHDEQKGDDDCLGVRVSEEPMSSNVYNKLNADTTDKVALSTADDEHNHCLYFEADNERAVRFSKFLKSVEFEALEDSKGQQNSTESLEKILESLGGQIVSSLPKTMAPPMPKRKQSTSPLMDIILNSSNNNNIRQTIKESTPEVESSPYKKRKLGRPKKHRAVANICAIQNLPNGENFVMPLSPESDVSATSEKNLLHLLKEDKSRQRSSQRYSSDDLYKPRPFFSSSSRRSRRTNQA